MTFPHVDPSAWAGRRVTIAVPDATRPLDPSHLAELVRRIQPHATHVDVVVALGLHRPMSDAELVPIVEAAGTCRVTQHDASDPAAAPFHPLVANADTVVCVGVVEPHQYAGFSGGVKTVSIGCASAAAIGESHSLDLLRDPGTRIGAIEGNRFQALLWERASPLDVWALQTVPSGETFFDRARTAFEAAVRVARESCFQRWSRPWSWLRLPVPATKAQSFYQASRAATYVALTSNPAIEAGGTLIVEAACPEGIGRGAGERAFEAALTRGLDVLRAELASGERSLRGGEQRAYVLARVIERNRIVLVGAPRIDALDAIGIQQVEDVGALQLDPTLGREVSDVFRRVPIVDSALTDEEDH